MPSPVGKFTVRPGTASIVVSVTGDDPTCWTAQSGVATHTMPKTVTTDTDFWLIAGRYTVVCKLNGVTIDSRAVEIQPGTGLTIDPDLDSFSEKASEFGKTLLAANNLSDLASASTALANLGASAVGTSPLTRTAVKTSAYNAVAGDLVPVDTTSGAVTITLPTAPANKTTIAVKHVTQGSTNAVTVALGGSDVFNKAGGATSATLSTLNQAQLYQYDAATAVWTVVADDLTLTVLDTRYASTPSSMLNGPVAVHLLHPDLVTTSVTPASGQVVWMLADVVWPWDGITVDRITFDTGSAAAGLTLCRFGLYRVETSNDLTLLARTANNTSLLSTANTAIGNSIGTFDTTGGYPATYTLIKGVSYAVGVIQVGTTPAGLRGANPPGHAGLIDSPNIGRSKTAQADLPTSITDISLSGPFGRPWCKLGKV